jgi:hypothetical protein
LDSEGRKNKQLTRSSDHETYRVGDGGGDWADFGGNVYRFRTLGDADDDAVGPVLWALRRRAATGLGAGTDLFACRTRADHHPAIPVSVVPNARSSGAERWVWGDVGKPVFQLWNHRYAIKADKRASRQVVPHRSR